jgi:hypothetical protein
MSLFDILSDYESNNEIIIKKIKLKYKNELIDYKYSINIKKEKVGGYIRYFNTDGDLVGSGVLVTINKTNIILKNTGANKYWTVKITPYYFFYKKHRVYNDKIRHIFENLVKV